SSHYSPPLRLDDDSVTCIVTALTGQFKRLTPYDDVAAGFACPAPSLRLLPRPRRVVGLLHPRHQALLQVAANLAKGRVVDPVLRLPRVGGQVVELGALALLLPDDQRMSGRPHHAITEVAEHLALVVGPLAEGLGDAVLLLAAHDWHEIAAGPGLW